MAKPLNQRTARGILAFVVGAGLVSLHACARAREARELDWTIEEHPARPLALVRARLIDGTGPPAKTTRS